MKTHTIFPVLVLSIMFFACNDANKDTRAPISPSETRSTLEYSNNELDTVPENANAHIHFTGSGNEPFWSIEIKERKLIFESPDRNYKTISGYINTVDVSGDTTTFKTENNDDKVEVTLIMQNCTDGMSGKNNSHKVQVSIKKSNEEKARIYEGCGSFKGK